MKHNCSDFQASLADYADGALGEREHGEVQAHLAECADCRRALGELRWVETLLSESLREAPVESLLTLPAGNIGSWQARRFGWVRLALTAAAACAVAAAWGVFHGRRIEPQAPNERSVAAKGAAKPESPANDSPGEPLQWADIEAAIEREASAARLAASAKMLAAQTDVDEYARRSWRLLAETFPETRAGREAARRAESPGERREAGF
ncbi:MAG TPA: zf-HC2 domain-containing protein [Pirellulales bacterium]|nr:zf-HC2 domain-containing protein [Pirellulales bacterium]